MNELKPCPFCGRTAKHYIFSDGIFRYSRVECKPCGLMMTIPCAQGELAREAWNRRTAEPGEIEFDHGAED